MLKTDAAGVVVFNVGFGKKNGKYAVCLSGQLPADLSESGKDGHCKVFGYTEDKGPNMLTQAFCHLIEDLFPQEFNGQGCLKAGMDLTGLEEVGDGFQLNPRKNIADIQKVVAAIGWTSDLRFDELGRLQNICLYRFP